MVCLHKYVFLVGLDLALALDVAEGARFRAAPGALHPLMIVLVSLGLHLLVELHHSR